MDNVAMALHIVYNTKSLKDAILKAVNLGGDCDSIGAVVGMLAGAMYGYDDFVAESYKWIQPWDRSKTAIRAYKLFHKIPVTVEEKVEMKQEKKIVMFDA
jgi:ADP-ribosyl-[dinitrogen reductase] hydrolase